MAAVGQAGMHDRLGGCGDPEVHERVHFLQFFCRNVLAGIEVADAAGKSSGELADIEVSDGPDARMTADDLLPGHLEVIAHRGDDSHPGDDDASAGHPWLRRAGSGDQEAAARWVM